MLQDETIQEVNDMRILEYLGGDNHVGMQGCRIEIIRKATDTSFKYEVSADFRSDDLAAHSFDKEMYNVNKIYNDGPDEDGYVILECDYDPRDIIERYLGCPDRAYWETSN